MPEMTVLVGGLRAAGESGEQTCSHHGYKSACLTETRRQLTTHFLAATCSDHGREVEAWMTAATRNMSAVDRAQPATEKWRATRPTLVFDSNSQSARAGEVYAERRIREQATCRRATHLGVETVQNADRFRCGATQVTTETHTLARPALHQGVSDVALMQALFGSQGGSTTACREPFTCLPAPFLPIRHANEHERARPLRQRAIPTKQPRMSAGYQASPVQSLHAPSTRFGDCAYAVADRYRRRLGVRHLVA